MSSVNVTLLQRATWLKFHYLILHFDLSIKLLKQYLQKHFPTTLGPREAGLYEAEKICLDNRSCTCYKYVL